MPDEVRLWRVGEGQSLSEIKRGKLDLEERLEDWLEADITMLDRGLLVIGRQVQTTFTGPIDLLCVDAAGDLVIVELKRDKTPRDITAQVLEYAAWVDGLSNERVTALAEAYLGEDGFAETFRARFGAELPETLNSEHSMLVVGSLIDESSERIIRYLSDRHGVKINAATFQYFREPDGGELVARVFLLEPEQVTLSSQTKGGSKRRPNLSYEELERQAADAGVTELYDHAVVVFEPLLRKGTTLTSIAFGSLIDGGRKVVLSLIPGKSSAEEGLHFQVYKHRLAALTGLSVEEVDALLPARREYWIYYPSAGPDGEGYQGFVTSRDEIDRLAAAIAAASREGQHV